MAIYGTLLGNAVNEVMGYVNINALSRPQYLSAFLKRTLAANVLINTCRDDTGTAAAAAAEANAVT